MDELFTLYGRFIISFGETINDFLPLIHNKENHHIFKGMSRTELDDYTNVLRCITGSGKDVFATTANNKLFFVIDGSHYIIHGELFIYLANIRHKIAHGFIRLITVIEIKECILCMEIISNIWNSLNVRECLHILRDIGEKLGVGNYVDDYITIEKGIDEIKSNNRRILKYALGDLTVIDPRDNTHTRTAYIRFNGNNGIFLHRDGKQKHYICNTRNLNFKVHRHFVDKFSDK